MAKILLYKKRKYESISTWLIRIIEIADKANLEYKTLKAIIQNTEINNTLEQRKIFLITSAITYEEIKMLTVNLNLEVSVKTGKMVKKA